MHRRRLFTALGLYALFPDAPSRAQRDNGAREQGRLIDQLLARYAAGIPADRQTRYDRAVAAALDEVPGTREHVRKRFTPATLGNLPAFAGERLERLRNLRFRFDDDAPSPQLRRLEIAPPPKVRIHAEGLHCFETTGGSGKDEAYACFVVVTPRSGPPGKRWKVEAGHFPRDKPFHVSVDEGDTVKGPRNLIYDGPAQDMVLMAVLLEHDNGDPSNERWWIEAAVKTVLAVLQENDPQATLDDVAAGVSLEAQRMPEGEGYYDSDNLLQNNDDDVVQARVRVFKKADLQAMAVQPPHTTEPLPKTNLPLPEEAPAKMPYHFRTRHKGDGAHYLLYYRVEKG